MSHHQKSQHCQIEGRSQPQRDSRGQVPMPEEEEATVAPSSSSTVLMPTTPREGPTGWIHRGPQRAFSSPSAMAAGPLSQSDEAPTSHREQEPFPLWSMEDSESMLQVALNEKLVDLVQFLLLKYRMREPANKAEMLNSVVRNYQCHFPEILSKACECLQWIFGIEVMEVDRPSQSYVLATSLGLTYDGLLSDVQGMPKTGLLIIVLFFIFKEGNCASEELLWEALAVMEVFPGREHFIFGDPMKLITDDLVREQYLVYRQVPSSDPVRYEFLWGRRAHAETSKMKVLEYWARFIGTYPWSFPLLYGEALREQQEAAQARDAGRATRGTYRPCTRARKCCSAPSRPRPGPM